MFASSQTSLDIFALPKINTVHFDIQLQLGSRYGTDGALSIENGKSAVKDFTVETIEREPTSLVALLKLPSSLENLSLTCLTFQSSDYFSRLVEGLVAQRHSLKRVHIELALCREYIRVKSGISGFWKDFNNLEELCVPINFLLFDGMNFAHQLKDSLPQSLIKLSIFAVNLTQVSFWAGQLEELLENTNQCNPH